MFDAIKAVALLDLVESLRKQGSWAGETHVQKAMFFLNEKENSPTGFDFTLYKHGPYSFGLHDFLSVLFASCLLEHELRPPYGPRLQLTPQGQMFLQENRKQLSSQMQAAIMTVAGWFGKKGVSDLERLATALWLRKQTPQADAQTLANKMHEIKPHIPFEDALKAIRDEQFLSAPDRSIIAACGLGGHAGSH